MKKIVFVTERMIMGGIEKSLISKLEKIPKDRYEVTVLLMGNNGELLDRIPKNVIVKNTFGIEGTTIKRMKGNIKKGRPITAFKVGWYTWLIQRTKSRFDQNRYYSKIAMAEDTEYDLAIAYHGPVSFPVKHVIENITAKRKIA
ncbi:MAG TPA: hypothetical protein VK031_09650, partial [Tissierellaceae bacterium]|nr:hypothetical protein [Tissierellaceae bacterium]